MNNLCTSPDDLSSIGLADIVDQILIPHTAYLKASRSLEQCFRYARWNAVPACLAIIGETRTGKSRALLEMRDAHPPVRDKDGLTVPILYVVTPAKPSPANLAEAMLFALTDPLWDKGTESKKTNRLRKLIAETGVRMIMIDEFQHFYDKTSHKVWHHVADWLKTLVDLTGVSLVTAGLPQSRAVIRQNEQLTGRFVAPVTMPRFDWRSGDMREEFRGILGAFQDAIGKRVDMPDLTSDEMCFRLWCATGGLMGYLSKLLRQLLRNAEDADAKTLGLADFRRAYREAIAETEDAAGRLDPFHANFATGLDDSLQQDVQAVGRAVEPDEPPPRRRRRKSQPPPLQAILRA